MSESWNCSVTSEEIKRNLPMPTLLGRYGIKIRGGMCSCPFHGKDRHPSMKVYRDSVHCFACGFHGDIFTVYQELNNCDFKTAFKALGGEYGGQAKTRTMRKQEFVRQKTEKEKKEEAEREFFLRITEAMGMCSLADEACEIFSDNWTFLVNKRDWLNYCYERKYIEGKEINEIDVNRVCREIRRRFLAIE